MLPKALEDELRNLAAFVPPDRPILVRMSSETCCECVGGVLACQSRGGSVEIVVDIAKVDEEFKLLIQRAIDNFNESEWEQEAETEIARIVYDRVELPDGLATELTVGITKCVIQNLKDIFLSA